MSFVDGYVEVEGRASAKARRQGPVVRHIREASCG